MALAADSHGRASSRLVPGTGARGIRHPGIRLALSKPDAAAALDISVNSFERHVQPDLRVVRRGKLRLFPVSELERWLRENAERVLEER